MNRLRTPPSLAQAATNFVLGLIAVCVFFGVLYLAALNDSRAAIQDALDARAAQETRLQRAARAVCNDANPGRATEPVFDLDGTTLRCEPVTTESVAYSTQPARGEQ